MSVIILTIWRGEEQTGGLAMSGFDYSVFTCGHLHRCICWNMGCKTSTLMGFWHGTRLLWRLLVPFLGLKTICHMI